MITIVAQASDRGYIGAISEAVGSVTISLCPPPESATMTRPTRRAALAFITGALLFAFALATHGLSSKFLWWDEAWSTQIAGTGGLGPIALAQVWQNAIADPWHPPLYYLLLSGWNGLVGGSPLALRVFSALAGLLALAWSYRLGAELGGRRVGLASIGILSGAAFLGIYAGEMRPYLLHALFGVMTCALYWRLIRRPPSAALLIGFAASTAGLLYTHYFALLIGAALGGWHLLFVRKDARWWWVTASAVAGAALFLPWVSIVITAVSTVNREPRFGVLALDGLLALLADGLSNGVLPFLALLGGGALVAWRTPGGRFAVWSVAVIFALAVVVNQVAPLLTHLRYLIGLWALAGTIAAFGAVWLWRQPRFGPGLASLLLIAWWGSASFALLEPGFQARMFRPEFSAIFRPTLPLYDGLAAIKDEVRAGDALLFTAPIEPWALGGGFSYYTQGWASAVAMPGWLPVDGLPAYLAHADRVWFVYTTEPPGAAQATFDAAAVGLERCATPYQSPALQIDLYARAGSC